jgi:cytoskeleton protein RodZ
MTDTIGQRLLQARLERGYSLEQIERATRVRAFYLKALEEDDFLALPSVVQGRGFLRIYATHLGLDPKGLLADWEAGPSEPDTPSFESFSKEPTPAAPLIEESPAPVIPSEPPAIPPTPSTATYLTEPPRISKAPSDSRSIFAEVGRQLSQQRLLLGLSLADVERYTRLRLHYLEAIESGNIDDLPSPVQGRGMLSNYARFLNLDSEALLLRFADALQLRRTERIGVQRPRSPATQVTNNQLVIRRFLSFDLVISSILIIALLGFVLWGASQILTIQKQGSAQPSIPPVAEVLLETETPSPTSQEGTPQGSPALGTGTLQSTGLASIIGALNFTPLPSGNDPIQIYVIARETTWVRVTADDNVVFQGRIQAGSAFPFTGTKKVEVLTGNAAALQVYFNQIDLGSLGSMAQVVDLVFNDKGLILPTPTVSPTITRTVPVTKTVMVTPTPNIISSPGLTSVTPPVPSLTPTGK